MSAIAKFYVQDEGGNTVGTFVIDVETMVDLYLHQVNRHDCLADASQPEAQQIGLLRRISKNLGVYRDAPGGPCYTRIIPLDDQL